MAPMELDILDDRLKTVVQNLYEIQSSTHGYLGPETQQVLIRKFQDLTHSLSQLSTTASALPTQVPPEIVDYVETGRNPDIYTREFVELVQRNNVLLKGKSEALKNFREVLAEDISEAWPELTGSVQAVLNGRAMETGPSENGVNERKAENGDDRAEGR